MTIDSLQTIVVADNYILTITLRLVLNDTDLTAECSADGIANVDLDVETLVLASPTRTEVRCNYTAISWHMETSQINTE